MDTTDNPRRIFEKEPPSEPVESLSIYEYEQRTMVWLFRHDGGSNRIIFSSGYENEDTLVFDLNSDGTWEIS